MDQNIYMSHVCLSCTVLSVSCSLVVICMERADLLALLRVVFSCHFPLWCPRLGVVHECIDS